MADTFYKRCSYISSGIQCDNWHNDASTKYCVNHRALVSDNGSVPVEVKDRYIDVVNEERAQCAAMSLDALDEHIAGIEKLIEAEKAKFYTARAIRIEKLDSLTEEERKARRAITLDREVKKEKPTALQSSVKSMIKSLMSTRAAMGKPITEAQALDLVTKMRIAEL